MTDPTKEWIETLPQATDVLTDMQQNGEPIGEAIPPESAGPPGSGNSPPVKASPEPETLPAPVRAGGAPPVDLNAFVLDLDSSALNIDTSLRRIAGALEAGLSAVERIADMAEAHELASRAQIAARAYVQMHQESASERVANLARIDDAGSQPAWDSADDALRDAGACQRAARGKTAALLSLLEQVAAPKDANRAADPAEGGRPSAAVSLLLAEWRAMRTLSFDLADEALASDAGDPGDVAANHVRAGDIWESAIGELLGALGLEPDGA